MICSIPFPFLIYADNAVSSQSIGRGDRNDARQQACRRKWVWAWASMIRSKTGPIITNHNAH